MEMKQMSLVMISPEDLANLKSTQQEILQRLKELQLKNQPAINPKHITAKEFMSAVRICRTKFNQLVANNKIKSIKKLRKIYVPFSEIERYFTDSSIK